MQLTYGMHDWPNPVSLVIPDSSLSTHDNMADFTLRVGFMARFAAMANTNQVIIYREYSSSDDRFASALETLLKFSVIPPYLRRRIFPLKEDLKYAGLMPPINIPTHPQSPRISVGDVRVALLEGKRAWVDADKFAVVKGGEPTPAPPGMEGLTFIRITSLSPLEGELCRPTLYSGFFVRRTRKGLGATLKELEGFKIATSRYGEDYRKLGVTLLNVAQRFKETFLIFGSPSSDLSEIAKRDGVSMKGLCDYTVNMDPGQVLKSIRTDEAIPLALITLNVLAATMGAKPQSPRNRVERTTSSAPL
ncbi:MAG: putative RNA uridine N3 methyltransferase [Candidatus Marsarchaeota archaeon]